MEKLHGTVKTWDDDKGFGFIQAPDMDDVFVHFSGLENMRVRSLPIGAAVSFVVVPGVRGPQAALVELEQGEA
ncbi:CspA family cold shock protein [Weissella uvarum]|uniref:cold-shock protein n=1 Tax=Weissella uvarum TaxID=1479233 RepID=UPI001961EA9F|nr:cold shock domain-containing protein [Weissella uvarum]MBM7617831.1 CspA family cold shock protein [Weissella uvarum]MCM0595790.1 cold shock domain-containing protein [Weissella uvarum]